jgi:hypothetical protein
MNSLVHLFTAKLSASADCDFNVLPDERMGVSQFFTREHRQMPRDVLFAVEARQVW